MKTLVLPQLSGLLLVQGANMQPGFLFRLTPVAAARWPC